MWPNAQFLIENFFFCAVSMSFASQKTLFFFLVMVYGRVGDWDEHSNKTFGLGRPRFNATSLLKIEAKQVFMNTINSHKGLFKILNSFFL